MKFTAKLAGIALASLAVTLTTPAFARQGADDPAGHVRQEDRRADRQEDRRVDRQADRQADRRADRQADRRADRAAEPRHGADDPAGHR